MAKAEKRDVVMQKIEKTNEFLEDRSYGDFKKQVSFTKMLGHQSCKNSPLRHDQSGDKLGLMTKSVSFIGENEYVDNLNPI
jgi:hypothetical protein